MSKYQFATKPYAHQVDALAHRDAWRREFFAWLMDMGTGKSKVLLDNAGILHELGRIDGLLIVAPKTVCANWVDREIPAHLPRRLRPRVLAWRSPSSRPAWWLGQFDELLRHPGLSVLVANVEVLSTTSTRKTLARFLGARDCMMAIDESTTIKNHKAKRTGGAHKLGELAKYRRILTGSPVTRNPLDLWAQCEFLLPSALGHASFYSFRGAYAQLTRLRPGPRSPVKVIGYKRLEELGERLAAFSYRVTKDECLDLPPKMYTTREVELTAEQHRLYEEMRRQFRADVESGRATADIVLTRLLRMQQILCGYLPLDHGAVHEIKEHRTAAVVNLIEETQGKVIIWAPFRDAVQKLSRELERAYGEGCTVQVHGGVSPENRSRAVSAFQDPAGPDFLVGTPQTGGIGLTLTAARTVVYYTNSWDLLTRAQSEDRAHRIGQTNTVTYADLVAPGTIDERVLKALRDKQSLADAVMHARDMASWV